MNLVLLEPAELDRPLPRADRRTRHILDVLRRQPGDEFDAGLVNGARGKATLLALTADGLTLGFVATAPVAPPDPLTLIVGLPRPQTARDILRDATTLGVSALHFVRTEKSEPGYAQSTLWTSGEWRRHVLAGAEQAFVTRLPAVTHGLTLFAALDSLPVDANRLLLDNYESAAALGTVQVSPAKHGVIAIGSERGWSAGERVAFRDRGFTLVHLGTRVLRTETATIAALTLLRAKLGLL